MLVCVHACTHFSLMLGFVLAVCVCVCVINRISFDGLSAVLVQSSHHRIGALVVCNTLHHTQPEPIHSVYVARTILYASASILGVIVCLWHAAVGFTLVGSGVSTLEDQVGTKQNPFW